MFGNQRISMAAVIREQKFNTMMSREIRTTRFIEDSREDKNLDKWQATKSGKTVATIIRLTIDLANEKSKEVYRE